jgi:hypothetical protein
MGGVAHAADIGKSALDCRTHCGLKHAGLFLSSHSLS